MRPITINLLEKWQKAGHWMGFLQMKLYRIFESCLLYLIKPYQEFYAHKSFQSQYCWVFFYCETQKEIVKHLLFCTFFTIQSDFRKAGIRACESKKDYGFDEEISMIKTWYTRSFIRFITWLLDLFPLTNKVFLIP